MCCWGAERAGLPLAERLRAPGPFRRAFFAQHRRKSMTVPICPIVQHTARRDRPSHGKHDGKRRSILSNLCTDRHGVLQSSV
jgi:hypothetical protein